MTQPPPPHLTVPGYAILDELGRGGMGIVYRARQESLRRIVALKVLPHGAGATAAERARFRREAESCARLEHEGIVRTYDFSEAANPAYLALEFVSGGCLKDRLHAFRGDFVRIAELVERLAEAVEHAHSRQVIHRDIKPANVLLTPDGRPKLGDFGLAKQLDASLDLTASGAVMGSAPYMAPEQATGAIRRIGPATDVWALGAVLYELLTGRLPFPGSSLYAIFQRICTLPPDPPERHVPALQLPPALVAICFRCLEKSPDRRFASAADLAAALAAFRRAPDSVPSPPPRTGRRDDFWKS